MKCFEYGYYIRWGHGIGIVFAETKERAIQIVKEKDHDLDPSEPIEITEIDMSKEQIIVHSYQE